MRCCLNKLLLINQDSSDTNESSEFMPSRRNFTIVGHLRHNKNLKTLVMVLRL